MERYEAKKLSLFVFFSGHTGPRGVGRVHSSPSNRFCCSRHGRSDENCDFFVSFFCSSQFTPVFLLFFVVFSRFGSTIGVGTHPKLFHTIFSNLGTMVHTKKLDPKLKIGISTDFLTNVAKKIEFPLVPNILTRGHPGVDPGSPGGKPGVSPGSRPGGYPRIYPRVETPARGLTPGHFPIFFC